MFMHTLHCPYIEEKRFLVYGHDRLMEPCRVEQRLPSGSECAHYTHVGEVLAYVCVCERERESTHFHTLAQRYTHTRVYPLSCRLTLSHRAPSRRYRMPFLAWGRLYQGLGGHTSLCRCSGVQWVACVGVVCGCRVWCSVR
jgi:hypothetical protein